jgi:hypothetical protein
LNRAAIVAKSAVSSQSSAQSEPHQKTSFCHTKKCERHPVVRQTDGSKQMVPSSA